MSGRQTIQEMIECGDRITVYCHNAACNHHGELDFHALRDKLGPDHGALYPDLADKLRCSKCRGKKLGFIRTPNSVQYRRRR